MTFLRNLIAMPDDIRETVVWLQRKETWRADSKANRLRWAALAIFTINEMVNYHLLHVVDHRFHLGSLLIAFIWLMATIVFHLALKEHALPRLIPYLIAGVDVFLLTWLLFLADGPQSPLVSIYYLIIALSGMRIHPGISMFTGGAATFGYLAVLEFTKRQKPHYLVSVPHAVIEVLCLLLAGVIMAHISARLLQLLNDQGLKGEK